MKGKMKDRRIFSFLGILLFCFLLFACNSGGGNGGGSTSEEETTSVGGGSESDSDYSIIGQVPYTATDCSTEGQNEFVYKIMTDTYLWYDFVPKIDPSQFVSAAELLDFTKYKTLDKWSYITPQEDFYAYYVEGKYIGLGFYMIFDKNGNVRIAYVLRNSPAHAAGLKRGDYVLGVNGLTVVQIEADDAWGTIFGEQAVGVTVELVMGGSEGESQKVTIENDWININTVLYEDVLAVNGKRIGYLVFSRFLLTSLVELDSVFLRFNQEGIDDLILDLRYNTGGLTSVANYLAGLIGGDHANGMIFQKYLHNDKHRSWDYLIRFYKPSNAPNLNRVIVITSNLTASASEALINGLRPFIDMVLIGDATTGKPVGMYGHNFCDKRLVPIEFKISNAQDVSDYYNGISPSCTSEDDISRNFGDLEEDSLNEVLYYIVNGECSDQPIQKTGKQMKIIHLRGFRGEIGSF